MDGRPSRRNKRAFSNLPDVAGPKKYVMSDRGSFVKMVSLLRSL